MQASKSVHFACGVLCTPLSEQVAMKEMKDTEKRVKREEVQRKAQYERDERKRTSRETPPRI